MAEVSTLTEFGFVGLRSIDERHAAVLAKREIGVVRVTTALGMNLTHYGPTCPAVFALFADVRRAARDDNRILRDRERGRSALAEHADQIRLIRLVGPPERQQCAVNVRGCLPHAVVTNRDGEFSNFLLEIERDTEILAHLVGERS